MWADVMLGSWVGGLVTINPRNFDTHVFAIAHSIHTHFF